MARGRLISRSLGSSRKFHDLLRLGGKLGEFCQVLFPLLIANTDDFGRLPGDAFTVKNVVLPSSGRSEKDFDRALVVITAARLVERYEVDGSIYIQVNKFDEHQPNLQKRTTSRFPEFSGNSGISQNVPLNLTEFKRTQSNPEANPEPCARLEADRLFDHFWASYPKKKAKEDALKAWGHRSPDPELLSVMLSALERQKASPDWQKDRGRYIPHPAKWLRQALWTDEAEVDLAEGQLVMSDQTRSNLQARQGALAKLKQGPS